MDGTSDMFGPGEVSILGLVDKGLRLTIFPNW